MTLAIEGSPISWGAFYVVVHFFLSLASSSVDCLGKWKWVSDWPLVNSVSSSWRLLKCLRMISSVSEDIFGWFGCRWLGDLRVGLEAFGCNVNLGSIQLRTIMQCAIVLHIYRIIAACPIMMYMLPILVQQHYEWHFIYLLDHFMHLGHLLGWVIKPGAC